MSDRSSRFDGLFGAPEDDPLLQDDPLAPEGDEGDEDGGASSGDEGPEEATDDGDAPRASGRSDSERETDDKTGAASAPGGGESLNSLLGAPSDAPSSSPSSSPSSDAAGPPSSSRRMLRITQENAADGRLAPLKVALNRGWRLQRIELGVSPDDSPPPFVFHLHQDDAPAS
jgi:hypothetical protein